MLIPKEERIRDEEYRRYVRGLRCIVIGCNADKSDFAHIRHGQKGGTGLKPCDRYSNPICRAHHIEQTSWPLGEADWYMRRVNIPLAEKNYRDWLTGLDKPDC